MSEVSQDRNFAWHRIQKFCHRNGVGVWKCDTSHLWFKNVWFSLTETSTVLLKIVKFLFLPTLFLDCTLFPPVIGYFQARG